ELMARPVSALIHPDDKERTAKERIKLLNNQPLLNFQNRYLTKQGETVWLEWTSVYLPDKETVFAIAKDITKRKLTELELHENFHTFRQLTTHFKNHHEKDRQYLAGELHEDLAQLATAIKMKMEWLASQVHGLSPQQGQVLEQTLQSTNLLVNKIRRISYTLSPANIKQLGLNTALQVLCTEFTVLTGISCGYKSRFREEGFSEEIGLDLYRVCQEALQNIWQHAQATRVSVSLYRTGHGLQLAVMDNGKGFDATATHGPGLATMQGRALSINGKLVIKSKMGSTTIRLVITNSGLAENKSNRTQKKTPSQQPNQLAKGRAKGSILTTDI
ncbi:MAG TPA: PAS domain-containing protein, partial [Chitinophagaceae bacterium]|nr:PAS domain-containing protein [Chitinophagaceae bacterium]